MTIEAEPESEEESEEEEPEGPGPFNPADFGMSEDDGSGSDGSDGDEPDFDQVDLGGISGTGGGHAESYVYVFLYPRMRFCRSDWPGLCLFCFCQPSCVVSQQS